MDNNAVENVPHNPHTTVVMPRARYDQIADALRKAEKFIAWSRRMTIEGQITTTEYALQFKPCDYDAMKAVDTALHEMD